MSAAETVVETRDLVKRFPGAARPALDGLSLTVRRGEFCVVIGLSGSGKSTFLRHLNGLHQPSAGAVRVFGVSPHEARRSELRSLRRRIGFIFQQFNLVGRLSALENVLTGALGRLRGPRYGVLSYSAQWRRDALAQLERVGLAEVAFQRADTLSGGQQQRVAIARTLLQRPELVLADEPVASLDPESSAQVMDLLFRIAKEEHLTVICSLHQVDLALGWATRMIGLRDGRLVLDQAPGTLGPDEAMKVYRREPESEPDTVSSSGQR